MIWTGTKEQLYQFLSALNNSHRSITFDHEILTTEVHFVDMTVDVYNNGALQTSLIKSRLIDILTYTKVRTPFTIKK